MRPPFTSRCRSSFALFLSSVFVLSVAASAAVAASSPGAAFQELPEPPGGMALTLQMAASTASVLGRITTIPEPASCLLFGTSVFGLLAIRRRLRRS